MNRITTRAGGIPVLFTAHFQHQWAKRIGPKIELPLDRISRSIQRRGKGEFVVYFREMKIVVKRHGHMLTFVTVWADEQAKFSVIEQVA